VRRAQPDDRTGHAAHGESALTPVAGVRDLRLEGALCNKASATHRVRQRFRFRSRQPASSRGKSSGWTTVCHARPRHSSTPSPVYSHQRWFRKPIWPSGSAVHTSPGSASTPRPSACSIVGSLGVSAIAATVDGSLAAVRSRGQRRLAASRSRVELALVHYGRRGVAHRRGGLPIIPDLQRPADGPCSINQGPRACTAAPGTNAKSGNVCSCAACAR
jgi:hypothetical protein